MAAAWRFASCLSAAQVKTTQRFFESVNPDRLGDREPPHAAPHHHKAYCTFRMTAGRLPFRFQSDVPCPVPVHARQPSPSSRRRRLSLYPADRSDGFHSPPLRPRIPDQDEPGRIRDAWPGEASQQVQLDCARLQSDGYSNIVGFTELMALFRLRRADC